ncbi:MAG TPA: DNA polymerase III subunit gamma/tau [Chloroflexi bacterium]|nr:DNA polymerase III subunit gamma/tau [Chloroflexota bacterium]
MAQALYRRWRPRTFEEVVGQEHVVRTLRNALTSGRVHHAYLFAGPRGTGKTTTARLLAKAVNCLAEEPANRPCNECTICQAVNEGRLMDLIEIDAASNTGVDDVRELRERVGYRPNEARYKVYVIDEVHMLSNAAFNALLKTLEEPPPHAIFVLATTEPQKIPLTVLSRCQRFDFRRIPLADIIARLHRLAEQEEIAADAEALALIARHATGSMRDAESLLDQLAAYNDGGITAEVVRLALGTGAEEAVIALTDALACGNVGKGLTVINESVERGADPRQFARQVVEHLRGLMLTRLGSNTTPLHVPDSLRETFRAQAGRFRPRELAQAVRLFSKAATEARAAWQPQLPLELAFVEAALPTEGTATAAGGPPVARPGPSSPRSTRAKPPPAQARPTASQQPTPSRPAAGEEPTAGDAPTLEEVQNHWPELLSAIRPRNLSLEALLRSGKPVGVENGMILIGFAHQFHRGKVEEETNLRVVEEALGKLLGQPVRVRCVLTPADAATRRTRREGMRPPTTTTAQRPAPQPTYPPPADDGLVQAAVEKLGAQVVHPHGTRNG